MSDVITDQPVESVEPVDDLELIAPVPGEPFEIGELSEEGPVLVQVNRLRTVEFLALMRAVARGVGPGLSELDLSDDEDEMRAELLGIMLIALPEASDDFVQFLRVVTVPVGSADKARVVREMANPSLDDSMRIIEQIVTQEADDIRRLVGKAQAMWGRLSKMYQTKRQGG